MLRQFCAAITGIALLFVGATRADAGNMLLQLEQGAASTMVTGPDANSVLVTNVTIGDYMVTAAAGSSNSPGTSFNAVLNAITFTVERISQTSSAPLVLSVLADDFDMPVGNPLYLGSSLSYSFTGVPDNSVIDFTSYFDANNTRTSFTNGVASPTVTLVADAMLTDAGGKKAPTIAVANPNPKFSLSSVTRIDLKTIGQGTFVNTTGSTEVRNTPFGGPGSAVPEPASLALLTLGGLGLLGARGRKRAANRK